MGRPSAAAQAAMRALGKGRAAREQAGGGTNGGGGGTLDKQNGPPLWRVGCGTGGSGLYKWGTKSEGPTLAAVGRAGGGEMQAAPLHCASEAALCCEATADGASGTRRKALIIPAQQKHGSTPPPLQSPGVARDGLPGGGGRRSPSDGVPGGGGGRLQGYLKANSGTLH